jgi:L-Ala-D/L-Glu epimerase
MIELIVRHESWPLAQPFTISRGSRTTAEVVVVELHSDGARGIGECVPYPRYDETVEGVVALIESLRADFESGLDRNVLQQRLPGGAARNALDDAFWDLEAKRTGIPVQQRLGISDPAPVTTAYTLSLDSPEKMGAAAHQNAHRPLLKSKLAGDGDLERMAAIRENAPDATLIVDANEGWSPDQVEPFSAELARLGIAMIEQPLPAAEDDILAEFDHPVPLCADESCHTSGDLERIAPRYDLVNIKLDKTGGLTEAIRLKERACALNLGVMVGCMIGSSLAMAPAALLAQDVDYVDLDGPLLLGRDRDSGLRYEGSLLHPPLSELWG